MPTFSKLINYKPNSISAVQKTMSLAHLRILRNYKIIYKFRASFDLLSLSLCVCVSWRGILLFLYMNTGYFVQTPFS